MGSIGLESEMRTRPCVLVAFVAIVVAVGLALPVEASLVAYYNFEEGSGTTINDVSGNGRTGTFQNPDAGPDWVPGAVGNWALDLNGSNQWVSTINSLASQMDMDGNKPKTVSVWVETRSFANRGIFDLGAAGSNGRHFNLRTLGNTTDRYRAQFWGGADFDVTATGAANTWSHFALVHDGMQGTIYYNGTAIGSKASALVVDDGRAFEIGRYNGGSYWDGKVDEVAVFSDALAQNQIAWLAAGGDPTNLPAAPPEPQTKQVWNFGTGNLQDWVVLHGAANFTTGDGGGVGPANSTGGRAHDGAHETFLMESPAVMFTGETLVDGEHVLAVTFAGGAGDQDNQGVIFHTPAEVIAFNNGDSASNGQKGLAFFNLETGLYDATIFENNNGGIDTRLFSMDDLIGLGVDPTQWYKLHYFENDQGSWGWGQLNSIQATAMLPEPGTLALISLGLAGLRAYRKRRRSA